MRGYRGSAGDPEESAGRGTGWVGLEQSQKGIKTSRDQEGLRSACHLATQEGEAGDMSEGERDRRKYKIEDRETG